MATPHETQKQALLWAGLLDGLGELPEVEAVAKDWGMVERDARADAVVRQPSLRAAYLEHLLDALRVPARSALRRFLVARLTARIVGPSVGTAQIHGRPKVGQRFVFEASDDPEVSKLQFAYFAQEVRAELDAVARAANRPGRPASDFAKALRRDARWLLLVETGWTSLEDLAAQHHQSLPSVHHRRFGSPPCDNCLRHVQRRLAEARRLVSL